MVIVKCPRKNKLWERARIRKILNSVLFPSLTLPLPLGRLSIFLLFFLFCLLIPFCCEIIIWFTTMGTNEVGILSFLSVLFIQPKGRTLPSSHSLTLVVAKMPALSSLIHYYIILLPSFLSSFLPSFFILPSLHSLTLVVAEMPALLTSRFGFAGLARANRPQQSRSI